MATSQGRRKVNHKTGRTYQYINGSAVSSEETVRRMQQPRVVVDERVRRNRARANRMGLKDILLLSAASVMVVLMLISYLQMQSELTITTKRVASLENQLNTLKLENDEELNRIESSINLEEIKNIAVEELGMTYAKSGQVVTISDEGSDYVRQMKDLPTD